MIGDIISGGVSGLIGGLSGGNSSGGFTGDSAVDAVARASQTATDTQAAIFQITTEQQMQQLAIKAMDNAVQSSVSRGNDSLDSAKRSAV